MGFRPLKPEYSAWGRRRRVLGWTGVILVVAFGAAVALDHLGFFGYPGDDWRRFDGRTFPVARVIDDGSFVIVARGGEVTVALAGIDSAGGVRKALAARLTGANVTLKLEPLQTRDAEGRLLAWVYLGDTDCVNIDLARDGLARADARYATTFRGPLEAAQADAHRHRRGLWANVSTTATAAAPAAATRQSGR